MITISLGCILRGAIIKKYETMNEHNQWSAYFIANYARLFIYWQTFCLFINLNFSTALAGQSFKPSLTNRTPTHSWLVVEAQKSVNRGKVTILLVQLSTNWRFGCWIIGNYFCWRVAWLLWRSAVWIPHSEANKIFQFSALKSVKKFVMSSRTGNTCVSPGAIKDLAICKIHKNSSILA